MELYHPMRSLGLSSSEAVDELMGSETDGILSQNGSINQKLKEIYRLIDNENFNNADKKLNDLRGETSDIPSVIKAEAYLESMR